MHILLTGATGLVGSYFYRKFKELTFPVTGLARSGADINTELTNLDFSFLDSLPPITHLVHTAALSNVDYCEEHPDEAHLANVEVTRRLTERLPLGAKTIFLSSDCVFDGVTGGYAEESPTNPINVYGRTKLEAEDFLKDHSPRNLILRINVVTGWDRDRKNLSTKLVDNLRQGVGMRMPTDFFSNPTFADELTEILLKCLNLDLGGVLAANSPYTLSRYDLATRIAREFGLDESLIIPVKSSEIAFKARRPLNSSMNPGRLIGLTGFKFRSLENSLRWLKEDETTWDWS